MAFRTKLDFSSNRQVKQHIETVTVLSGGTSFGVPFSSLPTGPDLTTTGITYSSTTLLSTFSGNSTTTVYSWSNPAMNTGITGLSAITPSISASTQNTIGFAGSSYITIDGNTAATAYTGVSFDVTPIVVYDLGSGNYSGSVQTDLLTFLSASTLDFTGRTIWNDVSGITRTQDLIITNNPVIGNVWTCVDIEGKGAWTSVSGGTGIWIVGGGLDAVMMNNGGNVSNGHLSIAEGANNQALGNESHAEGDTTIASGHQSHSEGNSTQALGAYSHAEGYGSIAIGSSSHAQGYYTQANGDNSHAEGYETYAGGSYSHAEGYSTFASGPQSHSEGLNTIASGSSSHAQGYYTQANGDNSHAEGDLTIASGENAHAEGDTTIASGYNSHAGGMNTIASGTSSFVHGSYSTAGGNNTIVLGANITGLVADTTYVDRFNVKTLGSGTSINNIGIDSSGNVVIGSGASSFTGGTITGPTKFTNGLTANTISATTYLNLPSIGNSPISIVNTSNLFSTSLSNTGLNASAVTNSIFFGANAGNSASAVTDSNFIGSYAGSGATNASYSNFFGDAAGYGSTNANQSNFIGLNAGKFATNASFANFIGSNAGNGATSATESNFIGASAGGNATNATNSNFLGSQAGYGATGATRSNFMGLYAGMDAINASYSNLFGFNVGNSTNSIGSNNIIIGTNITLPYNTTNSINLGGVLFGTGSYSAITGSPSTSGQTNGRIGINIVSPTESLDVSGNARFRTIGSSASSGALYYTSTGVLTTNTSDSRLKHNIQTLTNALDKVKQLRGVTYDWIDEDGPTRIGFIAQEVESVVPELTFVNNNSPENYMGVHYENTVALLVEAIKELTSGTTLVENMQTQTILAEDNNIDLNHNGTPTTALGGGITVLHAMGVDKSSELITDENGNWITNNDFIPNKLTIPNYTPSGSTDISGNLGNVTRDEDYLYIKTTSGWKRTNLESF